MLQEKNRKVVIITFVISVFFILATIAGCWNAFKENMSILPLIYAILAIASASSLFRIAFKLSDVKVFNTYVEDQVAKGRSALLNEIRKEEEQKQEKETELDDIPEIAQRLIPTGNFKNIEAISKKFIVNLANEMNLVQGMFYIGDEKAEEYSFCSGYALPGKKDPAGFKLGENLNGETAKTQEIMIINEVPEEYFDVESGLGNAKPGYLCIIPVVSDKKTIAVIELASFVEIGDKKIKILEQASELFSKKIKQIVKA